MTDMLLPPLEVSSRFDGFLAMTSGVSDGCNAQTVRRHHNTKMTFDYFIKVSLDKEMNLYLIVLITILITI